MKKRKTLATGVHRPEGVATNPLEVDDMTEPIQRLIELLLRWLLPASGRHRAQCGRRRTLWLAVHGIDAGPRWIHGVEVATR
ncbi:hypothetical protein [Streptomyces chattanoogensis]|uniref:Uncharacterized protein n=1 Tax=Streptomyces chattanoogensis TaxID=66876 RepID=A0A0N0XWC7_9ACTN|nr:hypothetical protein [Streptomyces chattanoogensis]KPC63708.1 hypothetical protein ADL29_14905 [Streptomyces chattanoogensis]